MEIKEHECVSLNGDLDDPRRGGEFQIRFVASLDSDNGAYAAAASYSVNCFPSPFGQVCVALPYQSINFLDELGVAVFTLEEFPKLGAPHGYDLKASVGTRVRLERRSSLSQNLNL